MAIAKISGAGLSAIAVSVALLWGCLISERVIVRQANLEMSQTLREVRLMRLRRVSQPVSVPLPRIHRHVRPSIG